MKKILTLLTASVCALSVFAEVYSGKCGNNVNYTLNTDKGLLNIIGTGPMEDYSSGGEAPWYPYQEYVKEIWLAKGITRIGNFAFWNCTKLPEIMIDETISEVGDYAFSGCTALTRVYMSEDNLTTIGNYAFSFCGITSVTLPGTVTTIGEGAFSLCASLKRVTIPASVTSIGKMAFAFDIALHLFCNMSTSPQALQDDVFSNLEKANCKLFISASAETAYRSATEWKDMQIVPLSGTAFHPCGDDLVWSFDPGSAVLSFIGSGAMDDIPNTQLVAENPDWWGNEFNKAIRTVEIPEGVTSIGEHAFKFCTNITSAPLPESILTIGKWAFYACRSLKTITIPRSVHSIGDLAFHDCKAMTDILVDSNNSKYCSADGVLFDKAKTRLIQYPVANSRKSYVIPSGVKEIAYYAFLTCQALESVTLPSSVEIINDGAFQYCENLNTIYNYAAPILIEASVFWGVDKPNCILYVPQQYYQAYLTENVWKDFNVQITDRGEAIDNINHKSEIINHKFIKDGQVLINRNGHVINVMGQPVQE